MPTGPLNRVADNALARMLLGWEPQVSFVDGLHRTVDWYFASKNTCPSRVGKLYPSPTFQPSSVVESRPLTIEPVPTPPGKHHHQYQGSQNGG